LSTERVIFEEVRYIMASENVLTLMVPPFIVPVTSTPMRSWFAVIIETVCFYGPEAVAGIFQE
jgi:hypothetical protein